MLVARLSIQQNSIISLTWIHVQNTVFTVIQTFRWLFWRADLSIGIVFHAKCMPNTTRGFELYLEICFSNRDEINVTLHGNPNWLLLNRMHHLALATNYKITTLVLWVNIATDVHTLKRYWKLKALKFWFTQFFHRRQK